MAHKGPLPSAGNFHLVADITALPGLYGAAVDFLPHIRPKGWTASRNFGDHKRGRRKRQGSVRPVVIITNTLVKSRAPFYFCPQGPARAFCRLPVNFHLEADITALPGLHGAAVGFLPHIRPKGWTASRDFGDPKKGAEKAAGIPGPSLFAHTGPQGAFAVCWGFHRGYRGRLLLVWTYCPPLPQQHKQQGSRPGPPSPPLLGTTDARGRCGAGEPRRSAARGAF